MHSSSSSSSPTTTASNTSPSRSLFTIFGRAENVHRKLLYELMSTVHEYLVRIVVPTDGDRNDASVVGQQRIATEESLFLRIHRCMEQILVNGLRMCKPDVSVTFLRRAILIHIVFNPHTYCINVVSFIQSKVDRPIFVEILKF